MINDRAYNKNHKKSIQEPKLGSWIKRKQQDVGYTCLCIRIFREKDLYPTLY